MFESFNESARRAVFYARYEASALGEEIIDSQHLLLGLLREGDAVTKELFKQFRVDPGSIREAFPLPDPPPRVSSSAALPLAEDAKKILAFGTSEAHRMGNSTVAPHSLLLAIMRVTHSRAAKLLADRGMRWPDVAEIIEPIIQHIAASEEKNERTPITLRASHYELLDTIASNMQMPETRRASREALVLAVLDAISESGLPSASFASLSEFREVLRDVLRVRWPAEHS